MKHQYLNNDYFNGDIALINIEKINMIDLKKLVQIMAENGMTRERYVRLKMMRKK
jgi:hypothetical protein